MFLRNCHDFWSIRYCWYEQIDLCFVSQGRVRTSVRIDGQFCCSFVANLLKYPCANNYGNTRWFDIVIAKIKRLHFLPHSVVVLNWGVSTQVTDGGSGSVWSVWSWVTELLLFGVVPLIILVLNVLVIHETRRLSADERRLHASIQMTTSRCLASSSSHHRHGSNNSVRAAAAAAADERSFTAVRYDTIWYDSVYLTYSKKLSLPHGNQSRQSINSLYIPSDSRRRVCCLLRSCHVAMLRWLLSSPTRRR